MEIVVCQQSFRTKTCLCIQTGFTDARDWRLSPEKSSDMNTPLLASTLPLPPPPPPPSNGYLERERSFRRSFKLPVVPRGTQQKITPSIGGVIPVPKIVETYRQKSLPLKPRPNGEIKLSPFIHRRSPLPMESTTSPGAVTSSNRMNYSPLKWQRTPISSVVDHNEMDAGNLMKSLPITTYNNKTLPTHMIRTENKLPYNLGPNLQNQESPRHEMSKLPFHMMPSKSFLRGFSESVCSPRKRPATLQHAKSLDELLDFTESGSVTVVLDPNEKSKYSRVTITASSDMLDGNVSKEIETSLHSQSELKSILE